MSFEGYYQCICANGHYFVADYDYSGDGMEKCNTCGAEAVWTNLVDDTNCDCYGRIDMSQFKSADAITETCPHCHQTRLVEDAKYRVPSEEEVKYARTYVNYMLGRVEPLERKSDDRANAASEEQGS